MEQRSSRRQVTVALIGIVSVIFAATLTYALVRGSSGGKGVSLAVGDTRFNVGNAQELTDRFKKDPLPRLFSDVSGSGQKRPIIVGHVGNDPKTGWFAVDAHPEGTPDDCFFQPDDTRTKLVASCDGREFPANGVGLKAYPWEVTEAGDLQVDLRPT